MASITSCVFIELAQVQVLNEVLDIENIGEYKLDDYVFDGDSMQLGTQEI
jgi:hypothetical protein